MDREKAQKAGPLWGFVEKGKTYVELKEVEALV